MPYVLGIALGHTRTTAAVCRRGASQDIRTRGHGSWGDPQVVPLDGDSRWVDSVLHISRDGSVLIGQAAEHRAVAEPERTARGFLGRVGDQVPILLGEDAYAAEALTATVAGWVMDQVADLLGGPAERIVLTHPPGWGGHRRGALHEALEEAGLPGTLLLPGPVAAAEHHSVADPIEVGSLLAVCRLGGEETESAVLRRTPVGFELLARVEPAEPRAGTRIDELLMRHVLERAGAEGVGPRQGAGNNTAVPEHGDPGALAAMATLRIAARRAKERLSMAPDATVTVPLPDGPRDVHVTRAEFEHLARPVLEAAIAQLARAVAPVPAERLAGAALVGGSARIPLATFLAEQALACRVLVDPDPGTALCQGAALAARPRMPLVPGAGVPQDTPGAGVPQDAEGVGPRQGAGNNRAGNNTAQPERPPFGTGTSLVPRDLAELAMTGDDPELGPPPPPRPPVEITPLEPPKRFAALRRRGSSADTDERDEDSR